MGQADTVRGVAVQSWTDITLYNEYSFKLEIYGDGGYRRIFTKDRPWNRFYIRPSVKYSPLPWLGLRAGVGMFYTDSYGDIPNILEIRPWQGISISQPSFRWIRFSHYFRLEQRIFYSTDDWDRDFIMRYRYQLSSRIQPNPDKLSKYVYFPLFWEIFAQKKDLLDGTYEIFGNESRVGAGMGYSFNRKWSIQFVFIWQRSRIKEAQFDTSDYLLRFQVRHELVPVRDMKRVED